MADNKELVNIEVELKKIGDWKSIEDVRGILVQMGEELSKTGKLTQDFEAQFMRVINNLENASQKTGVKIAQNLEKSLQAVVANATAYSTQEIAQLGNTMSVVGTSRSVQQAQKTSLSKRDLNGLRRSLNTLKGTNYGKMSGSHGTDSKVEFGVNERQQVQQQLENVTKKAKTATLVQLKEMWETVEGVFGNDTSSAVLSSSENTELRKNLIAFQERLYERIRRLSATQLEQAGIDVDKIVNRSYAGSNQTSKVRRLNKGAKFLPQQKKAQEEKGESDVDFKRTPIMPPKKVTRQQDLRFDTKKFTNRNGEEVEFPVFSSSRLTGLKSNGQILSADSQVGAKQLSKMWEEIQYALSSASTQEEKGKAEEDAKKIREVLVELESYFSVEDISLQSEWFAYSLNKNNVVLGKSLVEKMQENFREKNRIEREGEKGWLSEGAGITPQGKFDEKEELRLLDKNDPYYDKKSNRIREKARQERLKAYNPDMDAFEEDEDYITSQVRKWERQASKDSQDAYEEISLTDYAKGVRSNQTKLEPTSKDIGTPNVDSFIKNITRFISEGNILSDVPNIDTFLSEEQTQILSQMQELSSLVNSEGFLGQFVSEEGDAKTQQALLGEQLPKFFEGLVDKLSAWGDANKDNLNKKVYQQLKFRIGQISEILSTFDTTGKIDEENVATFFNQFLTHVPKGGKRTYSGDARRSILSKQGIKQLGNYPTAQVPQYLTGSLPFYPNKDEAGDMSEENNKLNLLYQLVDNYYDKTMSVRDGQKEFEELDNVDELNAILNMAKHIFNTLSPDGKELGRQYLSASGIYSTDNGELKDLYRFTEEDASGVIKSFDENKSKLSGKELEKAKIDLKQIQEAFGAKSANLNEQDALAENESITKFLSDFTQESFTKDELESIVSDEDITDYENIDTERIFADENKSSVTREELEKIIQQNIQSTASTQVSRVFEDSSRLLGELEEKTVKEKIQPYLEKYAKASTPSEKSNITKEINSVFGKNSTEAEMWKKKKNTLVSQLIEEQKAQQEHDARLQIEIDKSNQKSIEELENINKSTQQTNANVQEALTEVSGGSSSTVTTTGFIPKLSKKYKGSEKTYTGVGVNLNGEDYLTVDLEKTYTQLDTEKRKAFLESLQIQYENFAEEEKQIFVNDLARKKGLKGLKDTSLYNDFFEKNKDSGIFEEASKNYTWDKDNYTWGKRVSADKLVDSVIPPTSSTNKGNIPPLIPPMGGGTPVFNIENANVNINNGNPVNIENGQLSTQNSTISQPSIQESFDNEKVTVSPVAIGSFDDETHTYLNEQGKRMMSVTQLRDLLLHGNDPTFKEDNKRVREAIDTLGEGETLTADNVGMSEQDFDRHKNTIVAGAKGNIFHEYPDAFVKNFSAEEFEGLYGLDADSLFAKLQEKMPENLYKQLMGKIEGEKNTLRKLGVNPDELPTGQNLVSYLNAIQKSGMTPTEFSEQRLGFAIQKGNRRYEVAATPDQVYNEASVDSKTGYVGGYEAFQGTAQLLGLGANKGQPGFESLNNIDVDNLKFYVADIKDGTTQLIEYMSLTVDEFFNLVDRANKIQVGEAEPLTKEEQQLKMNRQLATGRFVGEAEKTPTQQPVTDKKSASDYYNSYSEQAEAITNEKIALKEITKLYGNQLKNIQTVSVAKEKIKSLDAEMNKLVESGNSKESDTYKQLEEQKKIQEAQIALEEQQFTATKDRLELVKSGIKSTYGQSQLKALNQQQGINAKESVGAGVKTALMDESSADLENQNKLIKEYLSNYKQKQQYERDAKAIQMKMDGQTGVDRKASQDLLDTLQVQMAGNQAILNGYDAQQGKMGEIQLSEENRVRLEQEIAKLNNKQSVALEKINLRAKTQKGLVQQIAEGFKTSLRSLVDYSLAYKVIGLIQQQFRNLINVTTQLDAELVNIQIATGNTRKETHDLLVEYNGMAESLGRTTQEVASASDDWLRAGYQGKEAAELTKASMELSTLGQIEASNATTYLISVLKGWRIGADEVTSVIDKLTAVDMQAAISAGDLAEAMSRANNVARLGGSDMNKYIGYITTVADATQKSAESVGESFKAVYSRFGNVAAGKFMASIEEQQSSDYNEDEWSNLNDIESVLGSIGIKLRDTATSFRNIDDVMAEIGNKWTSFNDVTQNAIATAVAGVRQRENVVTLFENWENVSKYEDIAANSYGTASEKMEAFTDSIEASKNRLTVAIEDWALFFKGENTIKWFYDELTFITKNLGTLSVALLGLLAVTNGVKTASLFTKGIVGLETKLLSISNIFDSFKASNFATMGTIVSDKGTKKQLLSESYDLAVQENLMKNLNALSGAVSEDTMQIARNAQQQLLRATQKEQELAVQYLQGNLDKEQYLDGLVNLALEKDKTSAMAMEVKNIRKSTLEGEENTNQIRAVTSALRQSVEAQNEYTIALRNGKNASPGMSKQVSENVGTYQNRAPTKTSVAQGAAMLGGMLFGGAGFGNLGEAVGGDTGKILGTLLGSTVGSWAAKSFSSGFPKLMTTVGSQGLLAGLGTLATPVAIGVTALLGVAYGFWKKNKEKVLEEARQAFKTASEEYQNALGASSNVSVYSKLVQGVDSLGRNVSLTDEEYQQFLDTSNSLAKIFPELIVKTDDMGNSFVGVNGKVSDVTSSVKELTQALQEQADISLLSKDNFKNNYNTAKNSYGDAKKELSNINTLSGMQKIWADAGVRHTSATSMMGSQYNIEDIKNFGNSAVSARRTELRKQMKEALDSMRNEAEAIIRQDSDIDYYNLNDEQQTFLNNVGSGVLFEGDYTNWQSNIEQAIESAKKILDENPTYLSLLYDEQSTASETQDARMSFARQLVDGLPESMSYEDKKGIMLNFGFEYDQNSGTLKDAEDYLTKLEDEFNVSKNDSNGIGQSLQDASLERVKSMYNALSSGTISTDSSLENVQRALSNDELKNSDNQLDMEEYYNRSFEDFHRMVQKNNFGLILRNYADITDDGELNRKIEEDFGVLTEETHNALVNSVKTLQDDLKSGEKTASESLTGAMEGFSFTSLVNLDSLNREILKMDISTAFPDLELDDGLINSYGELADALQKIADGLDLVKDAQEQWNNNGRISTKTLLDLVQQNSDYIDVLDMSGKTIKLKSNSEQEMAKIQKEAVKLSISDTISTNDNTVAQNKNEIAVIDAAIAAATQVNNLATAATQLPIYAKAVAAATKVQAAFAYATSAGSNFNWKEMQEIWNKDYTPVTTEKVTPIDTTKLENKRTELENNNADLEKANTFYRKLLEGGINLDEISTDFGSSDSDSSSDTELDIAQAKLDLIDKEAEAIKALDKASTLEGGRDTKYYELQRAALKNKKAALEVAIQADTKESERLGHLKDIQDVEVALRNLNDEELADKESWAETLGNSTDRMKQIYIAEIKSADTYEEKIEAQKKLRDLQDEEYENQKKLNDSMIDFVKREMPFLNPMGSSYEKQVDDIVAYYQSTMTAAEEHMEQILTRRIKERMKEVNSATGKTYTRAEAEEWAKQQEDYIAAQNDYYSAVDAIAQTYLDQMDARVNEIQRKLDNLEKAKPNEWTSEDQITDYKDNTVSYLNEQIAEMKNFLNTTERLKDEQINDTVDKINDAILAVKQAQIDAQEAIKDHQDKIYDAIVWQVNEYIKDINKEKDAINEKYDDEIERLNEINNAHERTAKLIDLENKLADAGKEKKRVFRQGVGWVYESDRAAVKDAQNALDDFYLQDKIDDLNNTKDAENQILDDRIQNWQDYLDALDEKHNAYQAEVNEQLLFEQLNVTTQQELYATMYSDMTTYIANADAGAEEYIGIFTQFLEDYKACLDELAELNQMATTLYDFQNSNPQAGGLGTKIKDTTSYIDWGSDTNNYHQIALDAAASGDWDAVGEALNKRQNKVDATGNDRGTSNKDILNSIVDKYGSDVLGKIPEVKGYSISSSSGSSSSSRSSSSSSSGHHTVTSSERDAMTSAAEAGHKLMVTDKGVVDSVTGKTLQSFSSGIENGAVTYTGLAMLHGTPTSPEYVLNSDQAYTLLHNLSTIKGADYESVGSNEINNFTFGDVNLPNVKDPSNFWSELMRATSNRFNVTKNK